ncbi:MAG: proteasome subunit beta [Nanoarchaeota archaeon]
MKDLESVDLIKTGTTTVAILCKDGVVVAADKRSTAGNLVANKRQVKVVQIADKMVVAQAGLVSDAQLLSKLIRAEVKLKDIQTGRPATVKEVANLLAGLLYANIRRPTMIPGIVAFLLGGADDEGFHVYNLGIDGSVTKKDDFESEGSGSVFALGVLETLWKKGMSTDEGVNLALRAVNAALQRDSATGNGIDVWVISQDCAKEVMMREIDTGFKDLK